MQGKNQGYGICGAKNSFSSKVLLDNWVEDGFGAHLAQTSRPALGIYETATSRAHCHPSLWPAIPIQVNIPTPLELIIKNKEGTPYSLLFQHGKDELPRDERFKSTQQRAFSQIEKFGPLPDRSLERERAKKVKRELDLANFMTTETRKSQGFRLAGSSVPSRSIGKTEALPVWNRQGLLTSTIPTR